MFYLFLTKGIKPGLARQLREKILDKMYGAVDEAAPNNSFRKSLT